MSGSGDSPRLLTVFSGWKEQASSPITSCHGANPSWGPRPHDLITPRAPLPRVILGVQWGLGHLVCDCLVFGKFMSLTKRLGGKYMTPLIVGLFAFELQVIFSVCLFVFAKLS